MISLTDKLPTTSSQTGGAGVYGEKIREDMLHGGVVNNKG